MIVNNFYSPTFMAKKTFDRNILKKTKPYAQNIVNEKHISEDFYKDIERFLSKKISKTEYLKLFSNNIDNADYFLVSVI